MDRQRGSGGPAGHHDTYAGAARHDRAHLWTRLPDQLLRHERQRRKVGAALYAFRSDAVPIVQFAGERNGGIGMPDDPTHFRVLIVANLFWASPLALVQPIQVAAERAAVADPTIEEALQREDGILQCDRQPGVESKR